VRRPVGQGLQRFCKVLSRSQDRSREAPIRTIHPDHGRQAVAIQVAGPVDDPLAAVAQTPRMRKPFVGTQPLVLVADDEPRITKLVSIALAEEGFRVVTANGGEEAILKAEEVRPDIVLLDIVMPDLDGIEVMRQLRERRPVPVILLTARGSTADKAKGLDLGADDYIAKPFHPDELAARVRAVIRRSVGSTGGVGIVRFDDIEIDLERRMVTRGGDLVQLSRTEWLLLQHLAANAGKVVLHTELLTKVWGPEYRDDLQYLRVWVSRVRRKLGAAPGEPGRIKTFQGIGYLLDVEPETSNLGEEAESEPRPQPEAAGNAAAMEPNPPEATSVTPVGA
jgi:two-component system KDP operon response regulator KdpE